MAEVPAEGRREQKQRETRARLLQAAYAIMSEGGIDAARIKDITDRAGIGFGTFYNYFPDKDAIARHVLDCMIRDIGVRIHLATRDLRKSDTALLAAASNRLVLRIATTEAIWQWWAHRPDLLFERIRKGFGPFAIADTRSAIEAGVSTLQGDEVEQAWTIAAWVMVGGIHDIVLGSSSAERENFVAASIMRVLGFSYDVARKATAMKLPDCGNADIDWNFVQEK